MLIHLRAEDTQQLSNGHLMSELMREINAVER
jgi:hypothetical protein